jgi:hypothetical protein
MHGDKKNAISSAPIAFSPFPHRHADLNPLDTSAIEDCERASVTHNYHARYPHVSDCHADEPQTARARCYCRTGRVGERMARRRDWPHRGSAALSRHASRRQAVRRLQHLAFPELSWKLKCLEGSEWVGGKMRGCEEAEPIEPALDDRPTLARRPSPAGLLLAIGFCRKDRYRAYCHGSRRRAGPVRLARRSDADDGPDGHNRS